MEKHNVQPKLTARAQIAYNQRMFKSRFWLLAERDYPQPLESSSTTTTAHIIAIEKFANKHPTNYIMHILYCLQAVVVTAVCGESTVLPIQHSTADECTNIYTKQNDKRKIIPTPKRHKMLRQKERWSTAINIHCRRGPACAEKRCNNTLFSEMRIYMMLAFRECRESRHNSRSNNYSQSKMGNKINYVHGVRRSAVFDL